MSSGATPLLLVGAGKMGGALLDGWLAKGVVGEDVTVLDPFLEPSRRAYFEGRGTRVASGAGEAGGRDYRVIILAVKPQTMEETLASVAPLASDETTILSVAAGVRIAALQAPFGPEQPVVRAMPNTPALVGEGAAAIAGGSAASEADLAWAEGILGAVGVVVRVPEKLLDAVTGLSGSGPAYVFLVAEAMIEAGVLVGLPRDISRRLAIQTIAGAGRLLAEGSATPEELRAQVTSPGGTTAAGLQALEDRAVRAAFLEAVAAATTRSQALGAQS